jgi:hypothetical protein
MTNCNSNGDCIIILTPVIREKMNNSQSDGILKLNIRLMLKGDLVDDNIFQGVGMNLNNRPLEIKIDTKTVDYKLLYDTENKLEIQIVMSKELKEGLNYLMSFISIEPIAEKNESTYKTIYSLEKMLIDDLPFTKGIDIPKKDIEFA